MPVFVFIASLMNENSERGTGRREDAAPASLALAIPRRDVEPVHADAYLKFSGDFLL